MQVRLLSKLPKGRFTKRGTSNKGSELMKNNCYHCQNRKVGCHQNCLDYKRYKTNLQKEEENRKPDKVYGEYLYYTLLRMKGEA